MSTVAHQSRLRIPGSGEIPALDNIRRRVSAVTPVVTVEVSDSEADSPDVVDHPEESGFSLIASPYLFLSSLASNKRGRNCCKVAFTAFAFSRPSRVPSSLRTPDRHVPLYELHFFGLQHAYDCGCVFVEVSGRRQEHKSLDAAAEELEP